MSDKIKVKMVDNKSTTTIKVNGSFLQRINNVYFEYIEKIGLDAMNEILPYLKNDTLADITEPQLKLDAYNIQVLIYFNFCLKHTKIPCIDIIRTTPHL